MSHDLVRQLRHRLDYVADLARGHVAAPLEVAGELWWDACRAGNELIGRAGPGLRASDQRVLDAFDEIAMAAKRFYDAACDDERRQVERLRAGAEETRAAAARAAERYGGAGVTNARVGGEPGVYRADGDHSFFRDLVMSERGDYAARERLSRHSRAGGVPVERASSTTNLGGLVPPQFLADLFAAEARAAGTFVSLCQRLTLPAEGMTLTVPLSATATLVSSQTTQNTAISNRDVTAVDLTVPVVTIAGYTDISWQSAMRGHMVDRLIFSDLANAWLAEHDRQAIGGTGANGEHFGVLSTTNVSTITVSTTDVIGQWRKVGQAIGTLGTNRLLPATAVVFHPRRWAYWSVATATDGRPLFDSLGSGVNVAAEGGIGADGRVGTVHGLPAYVDPMLPTTLSYDVTVSSTTDPVIVTRAIDVLEWRDNGPTTVRFDDVGSSTLTARLLVHGFAGFAAGYRAEATIVCAGSGMGAPTF